MVINYLKTALRSIKKEKAHTLLNVGGLAIGMACALLCLAYVYHEFTYENGHRNADRIYRIACQTNMEGDITDWAPAPAPLAPMLYELFPEVESYARVMIPFFGDNFTASVTYDDKLTQLNKIFRADSGFFQVFTCEFLRGDESALHEPGQVIINEQTANTIFGRANPIGEMIIVNGFELVVGGVVKNESHRSHMGFNMLISWPSFNWEEKWLEADTYTYILLSENTSSGDFKIKLDGFVEEYLVDVAARIDASVSIIMQPLKSIHLKSDLNAEFSQNGNILYVYLFALMALFVLVVSAINYTNIAIAVSAKRAREIGMRKSLGAFKAQVRNQFIAESLLIVIPASVIGLIIMLICLPYFGELLSINLKVGLLINPTVIVGIILLVLFVSVLSGGYPGFYIASFDPVSILKNNNTLKKGNLAFRKGLTIVQFTLSIISIIFTLLVTNQLDYINNKSLGFNKNGVMIISFPDNARSKIRTFKEQLRSYTTIQQVAACSHLPGMSNKDEHIIPVNGQAQTRTLQKLYFDENYIPLMGMGIVEGRNFQADNQADYSSAFLVNEAAVKKFGWENPIGIEINAINDRKLGEVVGVISDAHLFSLHQKITPIIMQLSNNKYNEGEALYIKVDTENIKETITLVARAYRSIFDGQPFEYNFLDNLYSQLYKEDVSLRKSLLLGCVAMIFISCLGLLALAAVMAAKKTKEIGIRKVLGASTKSLIILQMKEMIRLLLYANLLAAPVAYYFSHKWLQQFSYKADVSFWAFFSWSCYQCRYRVLIHGVFLYQSR